MDKRILLLVALLGGTIVLSGCSKSEDQPVTTQPGSQVSGTEGKGGSSGSPPTNNGVLPPPGSGATPK